ncbi:unnamed protein product [Musa acuminata subsp. malaccensis]|uniref:(wild Malaysian banana) hypothetical protein n=1 Tax=Musa acuminata subsp. malaccensis TaxID=214687 RepID=A0A804J0V8_MUSAM|nr:PREDICTED: protein GLUTAMINE DUMPER 4-like [Musa acuminata subsp. malaccensis]CAG1837511.1 unnamed protein product [Musa acuminata subsp. malaccensis]
MRAGSGFNATATAAAAPVYTGGHHSPVPYLFAGVAATLGLTACALLVLACFCSKFYDRLESRDAGASSGAAAGGGVGLCEEVIVVVMAGDEKPTFLAAPTSSRASSFVDWSCKKDDDEEEGEEEKVEGSKRTDRKSSPD